MYSPSAMTRGREIRTKGLSFSALHLLSILLLFGTCSGQQIVHGVDRPSLLRFESSVSDPAGLLSAWSTTNYRSWFGVRCDSCIRVVSVNISAASSSPCPLSSPIRRCCPNPSRRLSEQLPSALFELTELKVLSLPFNAFSDEIPVEIRRLERLDVVDLEGNYFLEIN